ncbi:DivIVA domain-containing protein [Actinacidiphila yeochonensis]|uniref:DivIVA domain-containing protein n=1 Tax=Actinacidiphila yeochonensis TaxID=89050 RepID=UPI00389915F8
MLIALVAVVAAVALAVLGDGGALRDADPDRVQDRLPSDRPLARADVETVRLPTGARGYRMAEVDEVLDRLGAELAERDARIAELEASLAGVRGGAPHTGDDPGPVQHGPRGFGAPGQTYGRPYGGQDGQGRGAEDGQGRGAEGYGGPEQGQDYGRPYDQEPYGRQPGDDPERDGRGE